MLSEKNIQDKGNVLFSVLIANYNNGIYIEEAIDSVFKQTYSNWEIIIVDDGSTDNSHNIYENYKKESRIKVYFNEVNKGVGYTKRRCAELANGEICGFLDPDDVLLSDVLEVMVKIHLEKPNVSVVYSRAYLCDEKLNITQECKSVVFKKDETYFDYRWYGSMNFASYKNNFYKQTVGISDYLKAGVDQDLYFKIEEVGDIFYLNKFTYKYRKGLSMAVTANFHNLWYWNLVARIDTCKRRKLDVHEIIKEDFKEILNAYAYEREMQVRKSKAYRLGKSLLKPFSWIKQIIKI